eukprot:CAMPEP_0173080902 /NCGR_PEP_ID=MMETSP1102-20130122/16695_1 /TAXON_ID=49646 /ORGANISM="Geminigera sp., Strain Caron Lab Isolate" /LENGTH=138 /DNA_ID=CAMNT_0013954863 /DNA_START=275 /DNA_END=689 /DNA_ORIENTATION=-
MSVETDCICNAGSTGPDGSCDECVAGKYKIASGDAACTNCSAGQYSTVVGAVSEWQCQPCTAGAYCTSGSDKMQACGASAGRYCPQVLLRQKEHRAQLVFTALVGPTTSKRVAQGSIQQEVQASAHSVSQALTVNPVW